MTSTERSQIEKLQRQGLGYRRIAAMTGISVNTVKSYCKRNPTPSLAEEELPEDLALCRNCGKPVSQTPHKRKKVYCSDKCRMAWWRAHPEDLKRTAFYQITCRHCGRAFESYGNAQRKFCSWECYDTFRSKGGEKHG